MIELAANTSDAEQEKSRQRSHRFDTDVARNVQRGKAARADHLAKERLHAAARCVLSLCDKQLMRSRIVFLGSYRDSAFQPC